MRPHSLNESWTLWLNGGRDENGKLASQRMLCNIESVEDFWGAMTHLKPITEIDDDFAEIQFFKRDVKPEENDPANASGGQWIIRIKRASNQSETQFNILRNVARSWEHLAMSVIGGSFNKNMMFLSTEIQGVVFSVFPDEFWIAVWNKTALDPTTVNSIYEALYQTLENHLQTLNGIAFEYLPHLQALESPKQPHRRRKHELHR